MFAGRYMWWVLVSAALFLFFSVFFPKLAYVTVVSSECEAMADGCGGLISLLKGGIQPLGYVLSGSILLFTTAARVLYVRLPVVWAGFFAVWFIASAGFFIAAGNMWMATGGFRALVETVPAEALYLAVFTLYLCFPLEDYEREPNGILSSVQWLALGLAFWISVLSFVGATGFANWIYSMTGSQFLMQWLEQSRLWVGSIFVASGAATIPHAWLFLTFLVLIAVQGILRARPMTAN